MSTPVPILSFDNQPGEEREKDTNVCQYLDDEKKCCKYFVNIWKHYVFFYIPFQFGCIVFQHKKEPNVLFLTGSFVSVVLKSLHQ